MGIRNRIETVKEIAEKTTKVHVAQSKGIPRLKPGDKVLHLVPSSKRKLQDSLGK